MNYYVQKMGGIGLNEIQLKWIHNLHYHGSRVFILLLWNPMPSYASPFFGYINLVSAIVIVIVLCPSSPTSNLFIGNSKETYS